VRFHEHFNSAKKKKKKKRIKENKKKDLLFPEHKFLGESNRCECNRYGVHLWYYSHYAHINICFGGMIVIALRVKYMLIINNVLMIDKI